MEWQLGGRIGFGQDRPLLFEQDLVEEIPQDWTLGLLVKLPKKGDMTLWKKLRGIMLLRCSSNILGKIILERMKNDLDERLRGEQAGFL